MKQVSRFGLLVAVAAAATMASGCTKLRSPQGYVIDADLVNAVQPGVDNRESVMSTLGRPTFTGQFGDDSWYYLSRDSRNFAFNRPTPVEQTTLRIRFNPDGSVAAVDRSGVEQVAAISPADKKTPTLGRDRGFFEDLFGNIGTVGAPGTAGGGAGRGPNQ